MSFLFSHKKGKIKEVRSELNFATKLARNKVMNQAISAITATFKQGRLRFIGNDEAEYTDKSGVTQVYTLNELASFLWGKMGNELGGIWVSGVQANLVMLDISTQDILKIILELKGG